MGKTLVSIFDDQSYALQARDELVDRGFSSHAVRLTFSDNSSTSPQSEESLGEKIANFFGFGDHDETYDEAVRRGGYVLTVDADTDEECQRAEDIIEEYEPIDIDEREKEWRENCWQGSRNSSTDQIDRLNDVPIRTSRLRGVRVLSRFSDEPSDHLDSEFDRYTGPERRNEFNDEYQGQERRAG